MAKEMERVGMKVPLLIGGATTSKYVIEYCFMFAFDCTVLFGTPYPEFLIVPLDQVLSKLQYMYLNLCTGDKNVASLFISRRF